MASRKIVNIGVLGLSLLAGIGALVVQAKQNDNIGVANGGERAVVAMVDMDHLYTQSGGPQQLTHKQADFDAEMLQDLNSISTVPYLKREELGEYITLLTKEKPDNAQQARLKELSGLSATRQTELQTLTAKKETDLTPADKTRIHELTEQGRLLEKVLPSLQEDLRGLEAQRLELFRREQMATLRVEISKVAKERGITQVFDAATLVYASNDLTPQVLQRLNKRIGK